MGGCLKGSLLSCLKEFLTKQSYFKCQDVEAIKTISAENVSIKEETFLLDLQAFIEDLQKIQKELQSCHRKKEESNCSEPMETDSAVTHDRKTPKRKSVFKMEFPREKTPELDPTLVQVRATNSEVERRINAFIERKKMEVDEGNKREFCNRIADSENSCARTDAVFIPHHESKSHVKVTRIHNLYGPQTLPCQNKATAPTQMRTHLPDRKPIFHIPDGVEERLRNIETHVGIKQGIPKDVFERLRILENRVLFLESLSPEYFDHGSVPRLNQTEINIKREFSAERKEMSLTDINARLKTLKEQLKAPIKSEPA